VQTFLDGAISGSAGTFTPLQTHPPIYLIALAEGQKKFFGFSFHTVFGHFEAKFPLAKKTLVCKFEQIWANKQLFWILGGPKKPASSAHLPTGRAGRSVEYYFSCPLVTDFGILRD